MRFPVTPKWAIFERFIARCQALEYTCGFNLDRRAYDRWNCITVVPGAISAVRKSAIDQAGGLSLDTLAEDTDLTLALHKRRQRIVYVPAAIAWTEAPESFRTLARQRSRWAYGTLQCLWKHRDMVFNWNYRALGWFSLPSVWFFQIVLVAVTPLVDLFLLVVASVRRLARGVTIRDHVPGNGCHSGDAGLYSGTRKCRAGLADSADAFHLPADAQLLHLESNLARVKGALVSWGKLERTASVPVRA